MVVTCIMKNIKCLICNNKINTTKYKFGNFPLCDDLIKIGSKKKNKLYPINLSYCNNCNTVFNNHKIKDTTIFKKNYHYRAKLTKDVVDGQKDLVSILEKNSKSLFNKKILDIGCNDGALLDILKKKGAKTIGIEPTDAIKDASNNHDKYQTYFDQYAAIKIKKKYGEIDFIIFTNVFAHINKFSKLIENLKSLITRNTKIVIENHYLGSVIKKYQFDSFYHEHPRTYSLTSFYYISKLLNMKIEHFSFPKRYGGNIRIIFSKIGKNKNIKDQLNKEKNFHKLFIKNLETFNNWRKIKRNNLLHIQKKYGKLKAKAFPARAALIIKFLNLNDKIIECVYEKPNSKKIGYYVPGTKIKIISDKYLKKNLKNYHGPILNLAWHIDKEIKKYLRKIKISNKIINILDVKEVKNCES
jgi:2-polyprenyl-3-methyl-5-hydroxy-6-metoxy-1,4-benzoquinol methylase